MKNNTRRRSTALVLIMCIAVLCAQPVFGATTISKKEISIDNIFQLAKANSPAIHANEATMSMLSSGGVDVTSYIDNINNASDTQIDPTVRGNLVIVLNILNQKSSSSAGNSSVLMNTMENANLQIAYGAVQLLLAYYSVENQLGELGLNIKKVERGLSQAQKLYELGMMSKVELDGIVQQRNELLNAKTSAENGLRALFGQIAGYLNYSTAEVEIAPLKKVEITEIDSKKREVAEKYYGMARYNSIDCYIAEISYKNASSISSSAERAKMQTTLRSHENAFYDMQRDAQLKLDNLGVACSAKELAQKKFELSTLMYELGMISAMDYESERDNLESARLKEAKALIDHEAANRKFFAFCDNGVWMQSSGSM